VVRQQHRRVVLLHRGARGAVRQARLAALYPTHGAYVRAVTRDVIGLVADRYVTLADGLALIVEAARSDIPG